MKTNAPLFLILFFTIAVPYSASAATGSEPGENEAVDIEGPQPELQQKPIPKIEELSDGKIPEVPKPITRKRLGPAEEEEIAKNEARRNAGTVTETEYEIKKDTLARDSNIKF